MTAQARRAQRPVIFGAIFAFVLVLALLLVSIRAGAIPTGPGSLTQLSSGRAILTSTIKQAPAEAGNIRLLDQRQHDHQGLARLLRQHHWPARLGDALGNNFYVWNGSLATGRIFASRNDTVDWSTINCTNSTGVSAENAYLGKQAQEADSVNGTFRYVSHPPITVANRPLQNCSSVQMFSNGSPAGADFWNVVLSDNNGTGNVVYATVINRSALSYRNTRTDFELLVGENGNATSLGTTPYYFYVELD